MSARRETITEMNRRRRSIAILAVTAALGLAAACSNAPGRQHDRVQDASPQPGSDWILSLFYTAPVPKAKDDKQNYDFHPVSSGPYKILNHTPDRSLTLVRNTYWDPLTDPNRPALPDSSPKRSTSTIPLSATPTDRRRGIRAERGHAGRPRCDPERRPGEDQGSERGGAVHERRHSFCPITSG
jgi:hypothetical protein